MTESSPADPAPESPPVPTSPTPAEALASVPEPLRSAMLARGFTSLTAVQQAVLAPGAVDRDLRITSQTGSGKTVAVGMLLPPALVRNVTSEGPRLPRVLLVTPTRELAAQVAEELAWLLRGLHARVVAVTGGTSVRLEQRALSRGADVVVGTPGRLVDHLRTASLVPRELATVVLDEADQMLDLGFRDELDAILTALPSPRRTHLVSATFSRPVLELARRYQPDAVPVMGTAPGASNQDITHVVHVVKPNEIVDALVNLLLLAPDELTLVFVRTRAETGDLAEKLAGQGFSVAALSGEMEQAARTRVMNAFRAGHIKTLVATDVAARGIDVPDVTRVVHLEAPKDPDVYTHRSGRTGRAGRKGHSILVVPPAARARVGRLLKMAGVRSQFAPVPDAAAIVAASDARLVAELTAQSPPPSESMWEPHLHALATQLLEKVDPHTLVHRLLGHLGHHGPVAPRTITRMDVPPPPRRADVPARPERNERPERMERTERAERPQATHAPRELARDAPRESAREPTRAAPSRPERPTTAASHAAAERPRTSAANKGGPWVRFGISTGRKYGMDPRKLLAIICRRGEIEGRQVGAIVVGDKHSMFDVHAAVADAFARAAARPDPREPMVRIERMGSVPSPGTPARERPPRRGPPPRPAPRARS